MNRSIHLAICGTLGASAGFWTGKIHEPGTGGSDVSQKTTPPAAVSSRESGEPPPVDPPVFDAAGPGVYFAALGENPALFRRGARFPPEVMARPEFHTLIRLWLDRHPVEAAEWLAAQPADWLVPFMTENGGYIVKSAPDAALFLLQKRLPPEAARPVVEAMISVLPLTPNKLRDVLHAGVLDTPQRDRLLKAWAGAEWTGAGGKEALAFAEAAGMTGKALAELAAVAARTAPEEALAATARSGEPGAVAEVLLKTAQIHPLAALKYFAAHPDGQFMEARLAAWEALLASGQSADGADMETLARGLGNYGDLLKAKTNSDPAAAADLLTRAWTPEADEVFLSKGREAVQAVAARYAGTDAAGSLAWARSLPGAEWRREALETVARMTARSDPAALSEWLNTVPPAPELDAVIHELVRQVPDNPAAAYAWAERISAPALQESAKAAALAEWRFLDPDSAPASAARGEQ